MLLTSFLEGEFITCRQYCEALGVNYRLDLLLEVDFYLLHCNMFLTCFLLFCRRWDVTTRSYSKCYWQPSKICTRPSPRSNRRGEAGTPLSARPNKLVPEQALCDPQKPLFQKCGTVACWSKHSVTSSPVNKAASSSETVMLCICCLLQGFLQCFVISDF